MSDRTPMDPFELRLTGLLHAHTEPAARPVDALGAARAAMTTQAQGGVLGRLWPTTVDRRLLRLLVAAALVIALAALAVVVGSQLTPPNDLGRLVFVRDGDLHVADGDGSGQTKIADGSADEIKLGYLSAGWSPDGRHIAAVRDVGGEFLTPAVDLMTAGGAVVRTIALDPGCGPSLSWSPDSSEVAIATCPADVPRDGIGAGDGDSGIGLLVVGLDASADREIALPPEWGSVASANPEVWTVPDLTVGGRPMVDGSRCGRSRRALWGSSWSPTMGRAPVRSARLVDAPGATTVMTLDWSSDGRRLAITGRLGWLSSGGGDVRRDRRV